jgi:YegS/Rv2252/BmrU family lipid kinase
MTEPSRFPDDHWMIIVNPNAGVKKGIKNWPAIERILKELDLSFDWIATAHREHAIHLTIEKVKEGYRNFAVVGGDGTMNEVLNGIFLQDHCPVDEITLGMIPVGTGNDWCRMFNVPFHFQKSAELLSRKKIFQQDIGNVSYYKGTDMFTRYFMNVAGLGYDALVAKKTNILKEKGYGGALTYFYFIFASLFQYRFMEAVIEVDGNTVFKGEIFSMNVGICKYNGGGMMQVPHAVPDDGLLDVTLIKKAPKWIVVRYARKLYDGSHINLPMVETFRGKSIRIRSHGKIYLEADGESLGHTPFTFGILTKALRVVTGELVS